MFVDFFSVIMFISESSFLIQIRPFIFQVFVFLHEISNVFCNILHLYSIRNKVSI